MLKPTQVRLLCLLLRIRRHPLLSCTLLVGATALAIAYVYCLYENVDDVPTWPVYWHSLCDIGILLISGFDVQKAPSTDAGWSCAWGMLLLGVCYTAILTGSATGALSQSRLRKGICMTRVSFRNHILLCGWSGRAKQVLDELFAPQVGYPPKVVLIDPDLDEAPMDHPQLGVIRGDPTTAATLRRANACHAAKAIVMADPNQLNIDDADSRTLLIALAIESFRERIYTCVEVLNPANVEHFRDAGVNEIISVFGISDHLCVHAALNHGLISVVDSMVTFGGADDLYSVEAPRQLSGCSFRDVAARLLDRGAVLVGVATADGATPPPNGRRSPGPSTAPAAADAPLASDPAEQPHTVVCGWCDRGHRILDQFLAPDTSDLPVVLVDSSLDPSELDTYAARRRRVTLVRGDPADKGALQQANIRTARQVVILAHRDHTRPDATDGHNLRVALALRGSRGPLTHCVAEVLNPDNVGHFHKVGIDEVISVMGIANNLCVHATLNPGASRLITDMVTFGDGDELHGTPLPPAYVGRTFGELARDVMEQRQMLLVAARPSRRTAAAGLAQTDGQAAAQPGRKPAKRRNGRRAREPRTTERVMRADDIIYVLGPDAAAVRGLGTLAPLGRSGEQTGGEPVRTSGARARRSGKRRPRAAKSDRPQLVRKDRLDYVFSEGDVLFVLADEPPDIRSLARPRHRPWHPRPTTPRRGDHG